MSTLYVYGCTVCGYAKLFVTDQGASIDGHVCPAANDPTGVSEPVNKLVTIAIS
jgi:hypothetical protein